MMTDFYEANGVAVHQWFLTTQPNRPGGSFPDGKAGYITIHETGNTNPTATAHNTARWLHNGAPGNGNSWQHVSFHLTVDDTEAWQTLQWNEHGWHAGDGATGTGNRESIGIEVAVNKTGQARLRAWDNAARVVAWLRDQGHGNKGIVQHNSWSGKDCPMYMRRGEPLAFQEFLANAQTYRQIAKGKDMTPEQVREIVREMDMKDYRLREVFQDGRLPLMHLAADLDADKVLRAAKLLRENGYI